MTNLEADREERLAYVRQIRDSFHDGEMAEEERMREREEIPAKSGFFFVKLRFVLSILLFAGFVYLDLTGSKLGQISAGDIVKEIKVNYDTSGLEALVSGLKL